MLPTAKGHYCDNCAKHVVDLTTKSDIELIDFFNNKKENVCGRLLSTQLNWELITSPQKANWYWLLPIAMGVSIFTPAKASELRPVIVQNDGAFLSPKVLSSYAEKLPTDTIKGKVFDARDGKPLAGVKIRRKNFNNVIALTDSAGNFTLSMVMEERIQPLVFELNGYNEIEQSINANMVIKLSKAPRIMIGAVTSISVSDKPLYIVYSGKNSCTVEDNILNSIKPEWIEKLEILKEASATAIYGAKAANGVILIGIKKEFSDKIEFSKK